MVDEIFNALLAKGAIRTKREFSVLYLGRAHNHYAANHKARITEATLLRLAKRLGAAGHLDLRVSVLIHLLKGECS